MKPRIKRRDELEKELEDLRNCSCQTLTNIEVEEMQRAYGLDSAGTWVKSKDVLKLKNLDNITLF